MRPLHSWTAVRLWPRHQKGVKEPQEQGGDHASPITHVRAAVREPNQSAKRGEIMVVPRASVQCRLKPFRRESTRKLKSGPLGLHFAAKIQ